MSKIIIPDFVQGESIQLIIKTSPSVSLVGVSFKLLLKKNAYVIDVPLNVSYTATSTFEDYDPASGTVSIDIPPNVTENIPEGVYIASLSISLGNKVSTLISGKDGIPTVRCFKKLES